MIAQQVHGLSSTSTSWIAVRDTVPALLPTGLHLATWGSVDPRNDQVSMWLGFPAASLSRLGLKGLPREAMLPIAVQGSLHQPRVKWLEYGSCHIAVRTHALCCTARRSGRYSKKAGW